MGSIKLITDKDGNKVGEYFYTPYGEMQTGFSSGTDVSRYKYTAQQEDAATGLYYYKARFYDPGVGRFLTADSVLPNFADTQAFNRYMYVEGNPVNHNDPSGHRFGGGFWKKITEKAVRCAVSSGINIVKKAPEVMHKVQSNLIGLAGNVANGLQRLPVTLAGFAGKEIENFRSIQKDITMFSAKVVNSINKTVHSIMESSCSLLYEIIEGANNTIFSHSWRTEQWDSWGRSLALAIITIAIIAVSFYISVPMGLFALSGALIGGTKGKPFDLESYSNFNWGYAAVGGTIGAFFGFIFNEFILTSETAVYPSFVTTLTKPIIGDTCAATLGLSLDYFSFMSCYVVSVKLTPS